MTDSLLRIEALFHAALTVPADERVAWLQTVESDPTIRETVGKLLANDDQTHNPLQPALLAALRLDHSTPQRIGRYRVVGDLGEGGMSNVLLAERDIDGRPQRVALKLLYGASTASLRRKAARERALLAALNHRGIASLIDGGESDEGVPYLVMEHVEGIPLLRYLSEQRPSQRERLLLFRQICLAIEHAHQRLILHLDLKPSNVLVRADGSTALIDFGIGQGLDDLDTGERTAAFTPIYAAPEQRSGAAMTTGTDVYMAGLLLVEILTDGALSQRARQKRHDPPNVALAEAPISDALKGDLLRLVAHAAAPAVEDRYPSITALRMDIDHYLEGRMLAASRQAWWVRSAKFCRRNRWPLIGASAAALLAIAFVAQLSEQRSRAVAAERNALIAQDMQASVLLALSPPGNPQAQVKIQELLHSERRRWAGNTDQRILDSTWRSVASVVTVAEIYAPIGDPEPALKTGDAALRMIGGMSLAEQNEYPSLEARANAARAQALNELERFDEAKVGFARMLKIREQEIADDRTGMVLALIQYGGAAIGWSDYALAEKLLNQAQAIVGRDQTISTEDRIALAVTFLNLNTQNESTPIGGEKKLAALLSLANATLTPDAPEWIEVWMVISAFHYRYGRYDDALAYLDRALQKSRAAYGDRSTVTANSLSFRAALLNDLGRHQEALENFDALRAIQASIRPDKAPLLAKIDGQRGGTLMLMGDYENAAKASEAAIRGLPETRPTYLRWRAIAMSNLARSKSRLGRHSEAAAAADQLMAEFDSLPLSALDRAMAPVSLSGIWMEAGHFDRVQSALDNAEASFKKLLPANHPNFVQVRKQRGDLAKAKNDFQQAERHYSAALKLLDQSQDDPVFRRDIMSAQVQMVYRQGDSDRARQLSSQTLAFVRAQLPQDQAFLSETEKMLQAPKNTVK